MVTPEALTCVCLLQACTKVCLSALEKGNQLHWLGSDVVVVVGGSLVDMYASVGISNLCLKTMQQPEQPYVQRGY